MLVWACIAPHGGEVIPELAQSDLGRMQVTRTGMELLGERCLKAQPDTIIVMTPHGIYDESLVTIGHAGTAFGELDGDGSHVEAEFVCNTDLVTRIAAQCKELKLPICLVQSHDENNQPAPFPLDWGCLVPLWFMGANWDVKPKVVVMCPGRQIPRGELVNFGRMIAEVCEASSERIAFICSADLGHGHDADGPYGFTPVSAEFDAVYRDTIADDRLHEMLNWHQSWIDGALTDAYWQTLVLHGISEVVRLKPSVKSYEAPTYFGMLTAEFTRE